MLSLLKKKSEAAAPAAPAWHPNFRNREALPDIKVVRTAFFVNGAAILAAVSLSVYFGFREWQIRTTEVQIAQVQAQIDRGKRTSDQAVALYKKFQVEEAKVTEVEAFVKSKPVVSTLILRLAETLPANIAIDSLDLRESGMALRLAVRGDAAAASGHATAYLEQLRADKELSHFDEFRFTGTPTRSASSDRMAVEFFLKTKAPAGGKKT